MSTRRGLAWALALFVGPMIGLPPAWAQPAALAPATFPRELVRFQPAGDEPVFAARGPGHWDVSIRERGWVLKDGDHYKLWYTGYDGTREGTKMLGLATSPDGVTWTRHPDNPIYRDHWVEDMMVVRHDGGYFMFAEGEHDQAQLLRSSDGVKWERIGRLDVRDTDGLPLEAGPYGTPTAWFEDGTWYLFYERRDQGVWLATSRDMKIWRNVSDDPVLRPGPDEYDRQMIALNQIVRRGDRYYALYHGSGSAQKPRLWCVAAATSPDLIHWTKYPGNPLLPIRHNRSSGIVVPDGGAFRLYTMHDRVDLYLPVGR